MAVLVEVESAPESGSWVDRSSLVTALSITSSGAAEAGTATCQMRDIAGTASISPEAGFRVTDGALVIFRGKIKKRGKTEKMAAVRNKWYDLTVQDATCLLVDDVVDTGGVRSTAESDAARIVWLVTTFGSKGVTAALPGSGGSVQVLYGSNLPEQDFTGLNLYEAIAEVLKFSGGSFYVDTALALHVYLSESTAAPWNVSDTPNGSTTFGYTDFSFPDDSLDLVNAVFVIGSGDVGEWVTDTTSINTYGRKEGTIKDTTLEDTTARQAAGNAILARFKNPRGPITFRTRKPGLKAGQSIQITNSTWGITAVTYRIQQVVASLDVGTMALEYDVSLQDAPVTLTQYITDQTRQTVQDVRRGTNAAIDYAAQFLAGRVKVVAALPTLPDAAYPQGQLVLLTSDGKLYRNVDGSTWSRSTDGADLVADSVTAGAIAAGAIGAEALAANIILGSLIQSVGASGLIEIDPNGIRAYNAADVKTLDIPSDGVSSVYIAGQIVASDLTVTGDAELRGTDNRLAVGSVLTAEYGINSPTAAPTIAVGVNTFAQPSPATMTRGLQYDAAGGAGGATAVFYTTSGDPNWGPGDTPVVYEILASNLSVNRSKSLSGMDAAGGSHGVATLGTYLYHLGWNGYQWVVRRWSKSDFPTGLTTSYTNPSMPIASPVNPSIASDGTNIYIVDIATDGKVSWNVYDNAMVKQGSTVNTGSAPGGTSMRCAGVFIGSADLGASRLLVCGVNDPNQTYYAFDLTGTRQSGSDIIRNGAGDSHGLAYDGSVFWTLGAAAGQFYQFAPNNTAGPYWIAFTWYDSAGTTHETTKSPGVKINYPQTRRYINVTTPALPGTGTADDPNSRRIYMLQSSSSTDPGIAAYWLQATPSGATAQIGSYTGSGTHDPSTNNFPNGTVAEIKSGLAGWSLKGDGSSSIAHRGGKYSGTTATTLSTSPQKLDLANTVDGQSAFLDAANDRVTIPSGAAGLYLVVAHVTTPSGMTGTQALYVSIYRNGATSTATDYTVTANSGVGGAVRVLVMYLAATDYIEVYAQGGSGLTGGTAKVDDLTVTRIGSDWAA